ncbi:unnamed protein product [Lupinus luteus]|uniref:Uncharacterized protein n=1 Tax=Lupinus luteus TaxID=3873 RepID=A0AAV1XE05_LUPLU
MKTLIECKCLARMKLEGYFVIAFQVGATSGSSQPRNVLPAKRQWAPILPSCLFETQDLGLSVERVKKLEDDSARWKVKLEEALALVEKLDESMDLSVEEFTKFTGDLIEFGAKVNTLLEEKATL